MSSGVVLGVMKIYILLMCLVWVLAGCNGQSADDVALRVTITESITPKSVGTPTIGFVVDGVRLRLPYPQTWETYTTQYGGSFGGIFGVCGNRRSTRGYPDSSVYPPPRNDGFAIAQTSNRALLILREILSHPDFVGDATISQPVPFMWDTLEAAYYLMDNGEGNLTVVIGIFDVTTSKLITASISTPANEQARIRQYLPRLLDQLVINDQTLSGAVLEEILPNPLIFPQHRGNS